MAMENPDKKANSKLRRLRFRKIHAKELHMQAILEIPDDLSVELEKSFENIGQAALEAFAANAYKQGILSCEQVRRLLNLESRWAAQVVLSGHGVWPGSEIEDSLSDVANLNEFLESHK